MKNLHLVYRKTSSNMHTILLKYYDYTYKDISWVTWKSSFLKHKLFSIMYRDTFD